MRAQDPEQIDHCLFEFGLVHAPSHQETQEEIHLSLLTEDREASYICLDYFDQFMVHLEHVVLLIIVGYTADMLE